MDSHFVVCLSLRWSFCCSIKSFSLSIKDFKIRCLTLYMSLAYLCSCGVSHIYMIYVPGLYSSTPHSLLPCSDHGALRWRTQISLKVLALDGCVSETFSEVVLRSISATVTAVPRHWNNHFLVLAIVREAAFEPVWKVKEFAARRHTTLHDTRFDNLLWAFSHRGSSPLSSLTLPTNARLALSHRIGCR